MDKLTLDSNVPMRRWRQREGRQAVEQLLELAHRGEMDLVVTRHIREDIFKEPAASYLRELPVLGIREVGGVFRLDFSTLDGPDVPGSNVSAELDLSFWHYSQLAAERTNPRRS